MDIQALEASASIRIHRPPADVYNAFVSGREMSRFWFTRRDDRLVEGKASRWFIGTAENAVSFEVQVVELRPPHRIVIEWVGLDGNPTRVTWTIKESAAGESILTIQEAGFSGSAEAIVERALDSTAGFNQVIIAAKAHIEHGVSVNVVADHA